VKWVIVIVVFILAAPTIAKRLEQLNPENRDNPDNPANRKRRGPFYRSVRRFGPRKTFVAFVILLVILAVAVYLLIRRF
jgi:hypothetical protein